MCYRLVPNRLFLDERQVSGQSVAPIIKRIDIGEIATNRAPLTGRSNETTAG
jgi:hypothetical protein